MAEHGRLIEADALEREGWSLCRTFQKDKGTMVYEVKKPSDFPTIEERKNCEWIPCSERLPEPRKAVLGYAPRYQNIYALYYDSAYGWMIWNPLRDDCFPNSQGEIVAWMPLPEPYQGEGREE